MLSTWEVDGLLSHGITTALLSPDDVQPYRGLVWGMEYPDLLITETTAFHDKAVADSLVRHQRLNDDGATR